MATVIQDGDPVLREQAHEVSVDTITTEGIQALINDMQKTLEGKEHGVALAAPQIGISKRIFVVAPRVFAEDTNTNDHLVYINPVITKRSKGTLPMDEGCLSVEGYYGSVQRAERVTVVAYNEHGQKFTRGASGLLAQIFQHEIDHLDGVLYIDKADEVHEVETDNDHEA